MKFRYTPEGASAREWLFKPNRLMNVEAEEIERRTGMTFGEWSEALQNNSMRAIHGLLFVLLKRDQPRITWDAVEFNMAQVEIEFELDEKIALRDDLKAQLDRLDPDRAEQARAVLAELDQEIAEEQPPAEMDDVAAPKADPPSETSGGPSSLPSSTSIPETSTV